MSIYLKISRVGRDENVNVFIFLFSFKMTIKTAGSAQTNQGRSGLGKYSYFFRP